VKLLYHPSLVAPLIGLLGFAALVQEALETALVALLPVNLEASTAKSVWSNFLVKVSRYLLLAGLI
jgi:hypothetical protein